MWFLWLKNSKKPQNCIFLSSRFFESVRYRNANNFYQEWYFFIIPFAAVIGLNCPNKKLADFYLGLQNLLSNFLPKNWPISITLSLSLYLNLSPGLRLISLRLSLNLRLRFSFSLRLSLTCTHLNWDTFHPFETPAKIIFCSKKFIVWLDYLIISNFVPFLEFFHI